MGSRREDIPLRYDYLYARNAAEKRFFPLSRDPLQLSAGTPGVLHGTRTYLMQDTQTGQIAPTKSISAVRF